jgi:hypothetical protein
MKAFDGDGRLNVGALVSAGGARYGKSPLQFLSWTIKVTFDRGEGKWVANPPIKHFIGR